MPSAAHLVIHVEGDMAIDFAERYLRRIGVEDQAERVFARDLLTRGHLLLAVAPSLPA